MGVLGSPSPSFWRESGWTDLLTLLRVTEFAIRATVEASDDVTLGLFVAMKVLTTLEDPFCCIPRTPSPSICKAYSNPDKRAQTMAVIMQGNRERKRR